MFKVIKYLFLLNIVDDNNNNNNNYNNNNKSLVSGK